MSASLKVAINCELPPGTQAGGTQSVVSGLLRAFTTLKDNVQYLVICHPENRGWLESFEGGNIRLVNKPQPATPRWRKTIQSHAGKFLQKLCGGALRREWPEVGKSDGFYESLGASVIHWPWQHFVVTGLPSVFNPHDLLHLHYPQFFQPKEIVAREAVYPMACRMANTVVVASQWAREDFIGRYSIDPKRVQIIPWAPPTEAPPLQNNAAHAVRAKLELPEHFAFYPAVTWEHKNHVRLLEAIARLRDERGLKVHLVCSGHRYQRHWGKIELALEELHLKDQVKFLGNVDFDDLRAIYSAAQFVFVPTLFEAASGPVFEAWQSDVPAACSAVTSLPQQVGNAALLFDPYDVGAIADALHKMATDAEFREALRQNARIRLRDFSWEKTACAYRAVYRRASGLALSAEEKELLASDWMANASSPS